MGLFRGGVPTKLDVDALMTVFEITPGTNVTYEDVSRIIGLKVTEHRFRSVTTAWRTRLWREKLIQSSAYGGSFYFLTADEAHDRGRRGVQKIGRATGRLCTQVEAINADQLTGDRLDRHNLLRRETQAVLETIRKSQKVIAGPRPVTSTVRAMAK